VIKRLLVLATACSSPQAAATDAPPALADAPPARLVAYVGGYSPSVVRFDVAAGALAPAQTIASFAADPSFLAIDPAAAHLYAVSESASRVGAYAIDRASGALTAIDDVASGGNGPAHLSVDRSGAWVLVANYGDGNVGVLPIQPGGGVAAARQVVLAGTNAHQILTDPSNRFAFVPCLGSDWVAQYTFDAQTGTLAPNAVPHLATAAGAGPRHLAFSADGKFAYLIAEKASTLSALALDGATGQLAELQTVSTLPAGFSGTNTGAEVWVDPSGGFVLASNRGDDSIAVFSRDAASGRVTLVGHTKTGGQTPRDFTFAPDGRFVYAANQGSNTVVPFAFDPATGTLTPTAAPVTVQAPTFVGIVALP
jgi:6-phosphogluconolactonase